MGFKYSASQLFRIRIGPRVHVGVDVATAWWTLALTSAMVGGRRRLCRRWGWSGSASAKKELVGDGVLVCWSGTPPSNVSVGVGVSDGVVRRHRVGRGRWRWSRLRLDWECWRQGSHRGGVVGDGDDDAGDGVVGDGDGGVGDGVVEAGAVGSGVA